MSVQRFKSLLFKATQIQQEILREQSRRLPDWIRLLKLKKIRLAIKDRMQEIAKNSEDSRAKNRRKRVTIQSSNPTVTINWKGV